MPDPGAEAKMRAACDAILQGDIMTAMADLTPQAMAEAMQLATGFTAVPTPESYAIEPQPDGPGGEQRFRVTFQTSVRPLSATVGWLQVEGAWKIASIAVETPPA